MSDLRKAAEMALEALEELRFANAPFLDEAMEALRQALAQPPVAYRNKVDVGTGFIWNYTEAKLQDANGNDLVEYQELYL
jgi:hypothetical protein